LVKRRSYPIPDHGRPRTNSSTAPCGRLDVSASRTTQSFPLAVRLDELSTAVWNASARAAVHPARTSGLIEQSGPLIKTAWPRCGSGCARLNATHGDHDARSPENCMGVEIRAERGHLGVRGRPGSGLGQHHPDQMGRVEQRTGGRRQRRVVRHSRGRACPRRGHARCRDRKAEAADREAGSAGVLRRRRS